MLQVNQLNFSYKEIQTLYNVNFSIPKGTHLAILGESGCGKSTLLKLLYGLLDADSGEILWKDKKITGPKYNLVPGMDFIKYQAQDFDLMPYITVAENVGKFLSNINSTYKKQRVTELLQIVEMQDYANTKAQYLSGGQMQRVALAKALAKEPEILLLDEPFSHIDYYRKNSLRRNLFKYLKEKNITCIVATHDSIDALSFADELIIMQKGSIIDQGKPLDIYYNPKIKYTACLFGDVNYVEIIDFMEIDPKLNKKIFKYPNQLEIVQKAKFKAEVVASFFDGGYYLIEAIANNSTVFVQHKVPVNMGETIFINFK